MASRTSGGDTDDGHRLRRIPEAPSLPGGETNPPLALGRGFFLHPPDQVARALLGKQVVRRYRGELLAGRIVETEAYFGENDAAAHAFAGRTPRTEVLFGPPGHAYVYLVYGMHYCLNVSCEPEDQAGCVLIRALEPLSGLTTMARLRGLSPAAAPRLLTAGPGRLCQAFGITRLAHNGVDVTDLRSELFFADDGYEVARIGVTPRIGIRKAASLPARFHLEGSPYVSAK